MSELGLLVDKINTKISHAGLNSPLPTTKKMHLKMLSTEVVCCI